MGRDKREESKRREENDGEHAEGLPTRSLEVQLIFFSQKYILKYFFQGGSATGKLSIFIQSKMSLFFPHS